MAKRINSSIYTHGKYGECCREILDTEKEYLYSKGRYPTKIRSKDLPENYIKICSRTLWYMTGYLNTSGIIDIKYEMRKINHLFKDDYLYISYLEPIQKKEIWTGYFSFTNYDVTICGNSIIPVVLAAEKYSDYDISEIKKQIEEKRARFAYLKLIGNADY